MKLKLPKEYAEYIVPSGELSRLLRGHIRRKDDFDYALLEHRDPGGSPPILKLRRIGRRLELSEESSDKAIRVYYLSADQQRDREGHLARRITKRETKRERRND